MDKIFLDLSHFYIFCFFFALFAIISNNFNLSGAVGDDPITRINLLCSRGIISWRNPVGAVHVQLKSDQTKSGRNCMKLLAKYPSSTKIHIAGIYFYLFS